MWWLEKFHNIYIAVLKDTLCVMENNDKNYLCRQGEGPGESDKHYLYNTIVHHNIPESNLIGMRDWLDIGQTNRDIVQHLFLYANNQVLIVSFPIWKRFQHLFSFRAP